jgi:hypothetical protein
VRTGQHGHRVQLHGAQPAQHRPHAASAVRRTEEALGAQRHPAGLGGAQGQLGDGHGAPRYRERAAIIVVALSIPTHR